MVMVLLRAASIDRLTVLRSERVDQAGGGHGLQSAIHRGQSDTLTAASQLVVKLLG
jgi:hypothetical protein